MGYFEKARNSGRLNQGNGNTVWKFGLTEADFKDLKQELETGFSFDFDSRDAFLYYAEWWKHEYSGGKPSKKSVFDSLGGSISNKMDDEQFYRHAKNGARRLGIKWITKQNTLYFRTMLMQGGLPLKHISENYSSYLNFLIAVLDTQPDSIEDFAFNSEIIGILPKSSQNEIIYENCYEIVRSILNGENEYDELLKSNKTVETISKTLKERSKSLQRKIRDVKPKNYWLLSDSKGHKKIELRIGLADSYSSDALSNILGFELGEREYQFYLNDEQLCVFRKTISGNYKTDWFSKSSFEWDGTETIPRFYILTNGEKQEVNDFIQIYPNLNKPSLWVKYSGDEWRMIKGNGTSYEEAAVLFPSNWQSNVVSSTITIYNQDLNWLNFEGEATITQEDEKRTFYSRVNSFDWTIISELPKWMSKTNMPVVQKNLSICFYDESGNRIKNVEFNTSIRKRKSGDEWQDVFAGIQLSPGCYDIKIERNGLKAYDTFYCIGSLKLNLEKESFDEARFSIERSNLSFTVESNPQYTIQTSGINYTLKRVAEGNKIPHSIRARLKESGSKSLKFEFESPLKGISIVDKSGNVIRSTDLLQIQNLSGLRILCNSGNETSLTIRNSLKKDVIIIKTLKTSYQPLISFKDEILRLFYLADAMDHNNKVVLELSNSIDTITYKVAGFAKFLNVECQFEGLVAIEHHDSEMNELYAVPLNTTSDKIEAIPMLFDSGKYVIPKVPFTLQFIIISSSENAGDLMPRFVTSDELLKGAGTKEERMNEYHHELNNHPFDHESWLTVYKYFNICNSQHIPFSTFDQLRSIACSSLVAARAFLFFGQKADDKEEYLQITIPKLEQELGFCFHWVARNDWHQAIGEIVEFATNQDWFAKLKELGIITEDQIFQESFSLIISFFKHNNLEEIMGYLNMQPINSPNAISNQQIQMLRGQLGERVLSELPRYTPETSKNYGIPVDQHRPVKLLLRAPIAAAESIAGIQNQLSIWSGNDFTDGLRRNMQYAQYLVPEFYKQVLTYTLQKN